MHTVLLAVSVLLLGVQAFFVFRPVRSRVFEEAQRVSEVLSMLPHEINVQAMFQRILDSDKNKSVFGELAAGADAS